jgi:hypothetical protein
LLKDKIIIMSSLIQTIFPIERTEKKNLNFSIQPSSDHFEATTFAIHLLFKRTRALGRRREKTSPFSERKRESIKLLIQLFNIDQFSLEKEAERGEQRRSGEEKSFLPNEVFLLPSAEQSRVSPKRNARRKARKIVYNSGANDKLYESGLKTEGKD